jgi:hypothetical protein
MSDFEKDLMELLAQPFPADQVKWKPGVVSGNRALALPYIDARTVQERLDAVVGCANWQTDLTFLPSGSVVCRLSLRIDGEWVHKTDVGGPSEQPDEGDREKAAVSDAIKRCAVQWGIARYLYRLPSSWCDWDAAKKRFIKTPQLPQEATAAVKAGPKSSAAGPTPLDAAGNGITSEQWLELLAACKKTGMKAADVLRHFGVTKPREIPAEKFGEAAALVLRANRT